MEWGVGHSGSENKWCVKICRIQGDFLVCEGLNFPGAGGLDLEEGKALFWHYYFFYLTLILLRLFQQHYCYNVTGQSQESEGSCKPARIKEVHSKLHSFQASLCTLTATHLTLIYMFAHTFG